MSDIALRCVRNKQDFISSKNNPSLSRDKQEIPPVREKELPDKSREEFSMRTLIVTVFQIILTEADQAVQSKCTMKKI